MSKDFINIYIVALKSNQRMKNSGREEDRYDIDGGTTYTWSLYPGRTAMFLVPS